MGLQRGNQVMAAPVYLPADPEIGAPEIPALPERHTAFVRNTKLLLREAHPGPAWPAFAAYGGLAGMALAWVLLFALCASRLDRPGAPRRSRPQVEPEDERLQRWRAAVAAIGGR